MIYSIFPSRDATIYENSDKTNTGIDEILELTKIVSSSLQPGISNTRVLIDFDTTAISQSIVSGEISGSDGNDPKYFLKIYNSTQDEIPYTYTLSVAPISQSWDMGIGKSTYLPLTQEGVSWKYRDGITVGSEWATPGCTTVTESGYIVSQTFNNTTYDVEMDISNIITSSWVTGPLAYQNNGILLQRTGSEETDGTRYGSLKYFSKETHTIFSPRLEVRWDDSEFSTGSLSNLSQDHIGVFTTNLRSEYKEDEKARIRLDGRELYPVKTYGTTATTPSPKYIPSSSYYSIVDVSTNETIIPFDTSYTKISLDSSGNYFNLWMNSLLPERLYRIDIRIDHRQYTNQREYYSCNTVFKVVR